MRLLMPLPIIHPRKSLPARRARIRPVPEMTPLMSLQVHLPRESLPANPTGELCLRQPPIQPLKPREALTQLRMVDPHVAVLVLGRREAEGGRLALEGAGVGAVVPGVVLVAGAPAVVARVEEAAGGPPALEEVGAVVVPDGV